MDHIPLYARGPYRVLELRDGDEDRPFVVVDTAGSCLHEDPSFDGARAWVDLRSGVIEHAAPLRRPRGLR